MRSYLAVTLIASLIATTGTVAHAEDKEPTVVFGVGGATEWALPGATTFGPSAFVEFNVIKDWLEIELGGARMYRRGWSGWESDVIFKKPFALSKTIEFMIGAGPALTYSRDEGTKWGTAFALDFMIWPLPERKFGWLVMPSYTTIRGGEKAFAVTAGIMFALY